MKMEKVTAITITNYWVDIDDPACRRHCWTEYWACCPVCGTECGITEEGWTWAVCDHFVKFDFDSGVMYFSDELVGSSERR
jgi:hypothetical protein